MDFQNFKNVFRKEQVSRFFEGFDLDEQGKVMEIVLESSIKAVYAYFDRIPQVWELLEFFEELYKHQMLDKQTECVQNKIKELKNELKDLEVLDFEKNLKKSGRNTHKKKQRTRNVSSKVFFKPSKT